MTFLPYMEMQLICLTLFQTSTNKTFHGKYHNFIFRTWNACAKRSITAVSTETEENRLKTQMT